MRRAIGSGTLWDVANPAVCGRRGRFVVGDADWLDWEFSAGDLLMVSVLLRLRPSGLLHEFPNSLPGPRAAKRGRPTSGPSRPNRRSMSALHRLIDEVL